MADNIKKAFDGIRAEETLKANTLLYLQSEMQKRESVRVRNPVRRFAVALASIAVIIFSGVFSYNLYFSPNAYIDVDVNPSVELVLNRFNRVIDAHAYNEDGEHVLAGLSLRHKSYNDALIALIYAINQNGYIKDDGLVSVTLQADGKETELLSGIQTSVANYLTEYHHGTQIDVFSVNGETRSQAAKQGVSPAKYLAIQELIEVDPTATVDSCRSHSISEIKQLTREHAGNHHGYAGNNSESVGGSDDTDENCGSNGGRMMDSMPDSMQGNGHHGEGNGYRGGHD